MVVRMAFGRASTKTSFSPPSFSNSVTSFRLGLPFPCTRTTSCLTIVLLVCMETVLLSTVSSTKIVAVHWNSTNPIFRIDNTDHIIDVNKGNVAYDYDQVNIICPVYVPGTDESTAERYIIYNVSKEEYDTCRITNPTPKIIAVCNHPNKLMYFTITFRSFSPQPGGLEFKPGKDYYFISTSSKDDLHRRIGGRCSTHNMKVVFKVCCRPEDMYNQTVSNRPSSTTLSSPVATRQPVLPAVVPTQAPTASHPDSATVQASAVPPTPNHKELDLHPYEDKSTTKKTNEYDKHPNEVVKNEELTYSSAPDRRAANTLSWLLLLSVLAHRWGFNR